MTSIVIADLKTELLHPQLTQMVDEKLQQLIEGCIDDDRHSQKRLYKLYYGYAMAICLRYTGNRDEAAEVMNLGFFKVFKNLGKYDSTRPFKIWMGRIMTNTAIDYYRAEAKANSTEELETAQHVSDASLPDNKLHYNDLLAMIQRLPQAYRVTFNLFAIEGYTHDEIAGILQITVGASKSNVHRARQKLKEMILNADRYTGNAGYSDMSLTPIVALSGVIINNYDFFRNNIR